MKTLMIAGLMMALAAPMCAQLFTPESISGAALGGLAGGIIGNNNGGRTAEGAAIGAGAGLLLGSLVHQSRRDRYYDRGYYGYPYYGSGYYSYAAPAPVYGYGSYYYHRPNYAITGAALGGVAGGIIGHNSHRHTGEGIAIGAGAGLLLGSLAEQRARERERAYAVAPHYGVRYAAPAEEAPADSSAPQQVTIINNYYNNSTRPMAGANALFGR